jgi:hypothetical protein
MVEESSTPGALRRSPQPSLVHSTRPLFLALIFATSISSLSTAQQLDPATSATYPQITVTQYPLNDRGIARSVLESMQRPLAQEVEDAHGDHWQATPHGLNRSSLAGRSTRTLNAKDGLPVLALTGIAASHNHLWLATNHGAILFIPDAPVNARSYFFAGPRYLPDDHVLQIVAHESDAWIRTQTGIAHIAFQPLTLDAKSDLFLHRLQERHNRYGYVASCQLLRSGDTASFRMIPDDNDGLWTSMYVASEVFRYAATRSPVALRNAQASLQALLRLTTITGIPGLPARSLMRKGDYREPGGEWHSTPDGHWDWKGDTSSDELVGHFFAYWVAWNLLPKHGDRDAIRTAVSHIAGGLLDHDLQLIGYNGKHTTWGRYGPEYLQTLDSDGRALDSLEILSHLAVAWQITGEPRFLNAYHRIATSLGYAENVAHFSDHRAPTINYSDNELAFLSFYPLMQIEKDAQLRAQYQQGLASLFKRVQPEHNPLWNLSDAQIASPNPAACADAADSLQRIPLSTVSWTIENSRRDDITLLPQLDDQGEREAAILIPPNERRVSKWNANPFVPDGGDNGSSEDDGVFFLLPYWLGRYHRLLPCSR